MTDLLLYCLIPALVFAACAWYLWRRRDRARFRYGFAYRINQEYPKGDKMEAKYLLVVKVRDGLIIRDTPRPASQGGIERRRVGAGSALMAYLIINIDGVEYAWIVPKDPQKPEWVRVDDGNIEYVEVIDIQPERGGMSDVAEAIRYAADTLAAALKGKDLI